MKTYAKFAVLVVVIIGTLTWLAIGGINETKSYYKTVAEVKTMGGDALGKRIRVAGDVEQGSIRREGKEVYFKLRQEKQLMNVIYNGTEPLPDTFRDGAQAVADGKMRPDGTFQANRIQAKCASKYEAKPGQKRPATEVSKAAL
jgi:cytochrome c-type biogenesis protein CcmE